MKLLLDTYFYFWMVRWVYIGMVMIEWDTFSDKNVMNLGGHILAKLIFTLSQNLKSQTKSYQLDQYYLFHWPSLCRIIDFFLENISWNNIK